MPCNIILGDMKWQFPPPPSKTWCRKEGETTFSISWTSNFHRPWGDLLVWEENTSCNIMRTLFSTVEEQSYSEDSLEQDKITNVTGPL